jgi:hypothetical protein
VAPGENATLLPTSPLTDCLTAPIDPPFLNSERHLRINSIDTEEDEEIIEECGWEDEK